MAEYDYVIVGAGSAGCVLAHRLSADPAVRILLVEAGGDERGFMNRIPAGTFRRMGHPRMDWGYASEPDATICGRRLQFNAGRMLGGSSAINGMVYIRGLRSDYAAWNAPAWDFDGLLPYFRRAEASRPPNPMHGRDGPLTVSPPAVLHPLARAFVNGCVEMGACGSMIIAAATRPAPSRYSTP
jgi:choline dehydrogenase